MANPMKSEATVRVGAGEFTLAYPLSACAAVQREFGGKSFIAVVRDLQENQDIETLGKVLWAGLKKHHNLSLDDVMDLIMLSEMGAWGAALGEAIGGSGEDAPPAESGQENPPKARTK